MSYFVVQKKFFPKKLSKLSSIRSKFCKMRKDRQAIEDFFLKPGLKIVALLYDPFD